MPLEVGSALRDPPPSDDRSITHLYVVREGTVTEALAVGPSLAEQLHVRRDQTRSCRRRLRLRLVTRHLLIVKFKEKKQNTFQKACMPTLQK